ncbi:hypothetical protein RvY_11329 [Ramazzottius varieornatus]|uniref:Uncharacterized protein n=1 Tax=Ramazzottius varieornatus TaxID=947166 RepID=A0A1D1VFU0_RAMVA|nr:hypothetical protein RvY_11329 [Ramazzottius varieornatus]
MTSALYLRARDMRFWNNTDSANPPTPLNQSNFFPRMVTVDTKTVILDFMASSAALVVSPSRNA